MKALRVTSIGQDPRLEDTIQPFVEKGDVLIDVAACGLNFADTLMISGTYQGTPEPPFTLGLECSGVVKEVGSAVTAFVPGDRVCAFAGQGGLAEVAAVPAERVIKVPCNLPLDLAAGFLVTNGTSHLALTQRANLQPGETLLVLGASGGVGLTAIEIGAALGARVIACVRGAKKATAARYAGAHIVLDTEIEDIRLRVKELGGADVVYDPVGGDQFKAAMRATKPGGRVLAIGFASGDVPQIPANILMVKNISVIGFNWGGYLEFNYQALKQSISELFELFSQGLLSAHVGHRFPFENAMSGIEILRQRKAIGKVIVEVNQDLL